MARTCTVCRHADRAAIDAALVGGEAYRSVAQRFAASPDAVHRHKAAHLSRVLARASDAREVTRADDLLAKLRGLEHDARRIALAAEEAGQLSVAIVAVRELARLCALQASMAEALARQQTVEAAAPERQCITVRFVSADGSEAEAP